MDSWMCRVDLVMSFALLTRSLSPPVARTRSRNAAPKKVTDIIDTKVAFLLLLQNLTPATPHKCTVECLLADTHCSSRERDGRTPQSQWHQQHPLRASSPRGSANAFHPDPASPSSSTYAHTKPAASPPLRS